MSARPRPEAIVLAAGRSSRMGEPKGLVSHCGRPWLETQLDALTDVVAHVVVVLGHDRERYTLAMPDLATRARVVLNADPDRGPFSSLQCGLGAVDPGAPVFVLPVDVPVAEAAVWSALEQALGPELDAAVPELEGRGGHPVLVSAAFGASLAKRPSEGRLDAELAQARVVRVSVKDPAVRLNLNVPEDWGKLARASRSHRA